MTTLLALYRRPDGGDDALAEFERRYLAEHLPLVAQTPGLRATHVQRVASSLTGETDLVLVTSMALRRPGGPRRRPCQRRDARRRAEPAGDRAGTRHPARARGRTYLTASRVPTRLRVPHSWILCGTSARV